MLHGGVIHHAEKPKGALMVRRRQVLGLACAVFLSQIGAISGQVPPKADDLVWNKTTLMAQTEYPDDPTATDEITYRRID